MRLGIDKLWTHAGSLRIYTCHADDQTYLTEALVSTLAGGRLAPA
jgi:hypothetical protein